LVATATTARILILLTWGVLAATSLLPTLLSGVLSLLIRLAPATLLLIALALLATLAALLLAALMIVLVHEFLLERDQLPAYEKTSN
jgi:hypothetical protein